MSLAAQDGGTTFFERVEVNLVNVEVFVTDRQGNRITGLTVEDFEVLEDGRRMTVTNFHAVEEGRLGGPPEANEAGDEMVARPALPNEQRLHLIVYVDNFNIHPANRERVFRELRGFLRERMRSGDRTMLVTFERSLNVRQPFTGDPMVVASALQEAERLSGYGALAESERRRVLDRVLHATSPQEVLVELRAHAESVHQDLTFTLSALRDFVQSLAGLPGRKAILYVSDGLPLIPAEDLYRAAHDRFPGAVSVAEARDFDATRQFGELAAQANANRVSFYALDAAGMRHGLDVTAVDAGFRVSPMVQTLRNSNLQRSLRMLADRTGGFAILNTNTFAPGLARVAEDFSTYYSLGYVPPRAGDGRYRSIKVRVRVPGAQVRHREGYRSRGAAARIADSTLASLFFGVESNPLQAELALGRAVAREDGNFIVPLWLRVPLSRVVLVPRDGVYEARLRIFVTVMDAEGGRAPLQEMDFSIRIPEEDFEEARTHDYGYEAQLLLRQGRHRVAVGLLDEISGEATFLTETAWMEEEGRRR